MDPRRLLWIFAVAIPLLWSGCSQVGSLVEPSLHPAGTPVLQAAPSATQPHLWGLYTVRIDTVNETVTACPERSGMFTANVVNFLNTNPMSMQFQINEIIPAADYVDVDINVALTHPFPGMPQYYGYDVRGVFMGNGSLSLNTGNVAAAAPGADQFMLDDPDVSGSDFPGGGPDGYTRWFNLTEFSTGSMPLLSYTPGNLATKGFSGDATINPYRYFADGLGAYDNLWTWLTAHPESDGRFSSGATNERNYYLRFPTPQPNVVYGYAVIANWEAPDIHPSNATEAVACNVADASDVWFVDSTHKGGSLKLDMSVFDWGSQISGGMMQDYDIVIESTVLGAPYHLGDPEMVPTGGDENYSTYHVDIPADNITQLEGNEFWVIVQYPGYTYANDFGVPNAVEDETLAAYFRYGLEVSNVTPAGNPICDVVVDPSGSPSMPYSGPPAQFTFDASGSYDPEGGALTFAWDFNNDGTFGDAYDSGTDAHPAKLFTESNSDEVCVKVTDEDGGFSICCVDVSITITGPNLKNIPLRQGVAALDLGVQHSNGDLWILYSDDQVWIYPAASSYQSGSYKYTVTCDTPSHDFHPQMLDVNYDGVAILGMDSLQVMWKWHYAADGTKIAEFGLCGACDIGTKRMPDVTAFTSSAGIYSNHLAEIAGGYWSSTSWRQWWYNYGPPDYADITGQWGSCLVGTGLGGIDFRTIVALEADRDGQYLWVLKGSGENLCTMWQITPPTGFPYLNYANSYIPKSSDLSHWHSPIDLGRDNNNRLLLLDSNAGQGIVTVWVPDSTGGSYKGEVGNASTMSETPRRIDGSDFDGKVFVIHGNSYTGANCYKLSVFLPSEMP